MSDFEIIIKKIDKDIEITIEDDAACRVFCEKGCSGSGF